eukprot:14731807-Alexandrium_andersonii.AAC.1
MVWSRSRIRSCWQSRARQWSCASPSLLMTLLRPHHSELLGIGRSPLVPATCPRRAGMDGPSGSEALQTSGLVAHTETRRLPKQRAFCLRA